MLSTFSARRSCYSRRPVNFLYVNLREKPMVCWIQHVNLFFFLPFSSLVNSAPRKKKKKLIHILVVHFFFLFLKTFLPSSWYNCVWMENTCHCEMQYIAMYSNSNTHNMFSISLHFPGSLSFPFSLFKKKTLRIETWFLINCDKPDAKRFLAIYLSLYKI